MNEPLRPFGMRIGRVVRDAGLPFDAVLKDYALSYILAGIAAVPELASGLAFKGGTALRKCFFPGYRYSEDLDFSADGPTWPEEDFGPLMQAACRHAEERAGEYGPFQFTPTAARHRRAHDVGQLNYKVAVSYPTGASLPIKVEVTMVERLVFRREHRRIHHEFAGEHIDATIQTYALGEIVLEKLRAFVQTRANLERRDWTNRARDLYDIWDLWTNHQDMVQWTELLEALAVKAACRGVAFEGPDDFRDPRVMDRYKAQWRGRLEGFVRSLPSFEEAATAHDQVLDAVFGLTRLQAASGR